MANVRLEKISRRFKNVTAIENITFEVPNGEFWVLVGPSGCGKSTILRTIAGLETATSGNLYIGDTLVNTLPARARDVAMVFQNYALYPHMTVAQNLAFGLEMRQVERETIQQRVEAVAKSLNISHLLDRKPKQLSGGQQQRVALGRAIARKPQVFLLDEPLSNLDAQLRDETRGELKQLHSRLGITTIYVTHDRVEAMTLADRIVVLDRGQIQQIGDPQSIYAKPQNRMVATFIGTPPMNILRGRYQEGCLRIGDWVLALPFEVREELQEYEGKELDLGIRPEDIVIQPQSHEEGMLLVEVKVVEPLGRETLIRAALVESEGVVNIQAIGNWRGSVGDRFPIKLDLNHLFVFDTTTGIRLYPSRSTV